MKYVLRFVQNYRPADRAAFMALEAKFDALEKRRPDLPQGRRMQPWAGGLPTNTLVWECTFDSMDKLQAGLAALTALSGDPEHEHLFQQQAPLMVDTYTEIYEALEF